MTPVDEVRAALLDELSESPLPGARYAHQVVDRRLDALIAAIRAETPHEHRHITQGCRWCRSDMDQYANEKLAALREDVARAVTVWLANDRKGLDGAMTDLAALDATDRHQPGSPLVPLVERDAALATIDALREGADKT